MDNSEYLNKHKSYFINPRLDLVSMMDYNPAQKVLEVGMGGGDTLLYIKQQKLASEAVGVDIVQLKGSNQEHPLIDKLYILDLENDLLPFQENYFDVIIAGDVLEHLVDPWRVLKELTKYLKPGGYILISLPNIRDMYAVIPIVLRGDFAYADKGLFDKTHVRFFCKKNMKELIKSTGNLKLDKILPIQNYGSQNLKRKVFNILTLKIFEEFVTSQYLIRAVKF